MNWELADGSKDAISLMWRCLGKGTNRTSCQIYRKLDIEIVLIGILDEFRLLMRLNWAYKSEMLPNYKWSVFLFFFKKLANFLKNIFAFFSILHFWQSCLVSVLFIFLVALFLLCFHFYSFFQLINTAFFLIWR